MKRHNVRQLTCWWIGNCRLFVSNDACFLNVSDLHTESDRSKHNKVGAGNAIASCPIP
ncbi:hypothetical protein [Nostoc sp. FACHB-87]|uniref:hypothetical protein n=1 Tax=Nostoc sp. FACHB-87 TaxID=2692841 RepID=UPI0016868DE2|nr:hypothetical protein [Nostoc sp. FACHB-87]MBD2478612.1 hypothetical protein [Anabaena sp. FACHB-83]